MLELKSGLTWGSSSPDLPLTDLSTKGGVGAGGALASRTARGRTERGLPARQPRGGPLSQALRPRKAQLPALRGEGSLATPRWAAAGTAG